MQPENCFTVDFDYSLSETITLKISASVQLRHSQPHYHISDFHVLNNSKGRSLLPDINIMAIKKGNTISWVHTDSLKETILSTAIGKAIEATNSFEITSNED
jgi:hypothetical protein